MSRASRRFIVVIVAVLVASLSLTGCESLRKKFTRQKKKDKMAEADFIPVLEPEEYPAPEQNPPVNYKNHYALVKAWYKDLWTMIEEQSSAKRGKYVLKQIYGHLDEMQKLVAPAKQAEVARLRGFLKYYDEALGDPLPSRNISRMQSDLRAFDRQLRALSPSKMQGSFVPMTATDKKIANDAAD